MITIDPEVVAFITDLRYKIASWDGPDSEKKTAGELIDGIQNQFESGKPNKTIVSTLLNNLPQIADITSIAASLLALFQAS